MASKKCVVAPKMNAGLHFGTVASEARATAIDARPMAKKAARFAAARHRGCLETRETRSPASEPSWFFCGSESLSSPCSSFCSRMRMEFTLTDASTKSCTW